MCKCILNYSRTFCKILDPRTYTTANTRTCFHEHEILQNCCTRTFRTYKHAMDIAMFIHLSSLTNILQDFGPSNMFTANMRTCFHEHELLQNCCTRTFRTYEHASNMPSNMRTYVDTNNVHEHAILQNCFQNCMFANIRSPRTCSNTCSRTRVHEHDEHTNTRSRRN